MIDLDDPQALRLADPQGMLDAVLSLPGDCRAAYDSARLAERLPSSDGIVAVTFCGMGGSAVSGDVVRSVFLERLGIPIEVSRSPVLPEHCGSHTLVVCSSYSGNTAETLAAFREAMRRGCRVLVVTSGGTIADEAADAGVASVRVPGGYQPRAALGHLAFASLSALETIGLLPSLGEDVAEAVAEMEKALAEMGPDVPAADNAAKTLTARIGERFPVVWGADGIGAVAAARWKTQMNENGKVPAFWSSMSELDHNEVVGWTAPHGERFFVVALRHEGEDPQLPPRFPLSFDIVRSAGAEVEEVHARGTSSLARLMSLVIVGDLTSVYLAIARGVDPTPVPVIERLKAALAGS
ncbi:MAG: bifunctional phosphoglucose/phosphomannose isomerase [Actinomycetota bacterium]